jgi:DNA helicase HerA-like ATPase
MADYKIGKVISVSGDTINISLYDHFDSDETIYGVPDNMNITIDTSLGPIPVLIGQPGTFVMVSIPNGMLLSMITDISMKETTALNSEIKKAESSDEFLIQSPLRIVSVIPVGTIDASGKFERGTDLLPTVNNDVFAVLPDLIDKVYESFAEGNFSIGELSLIKNQDAKINLDSFLSRHAAILGQTGGGKSWTVASLLQNIARFPKSSVVLFDLHGEYKQSKDGNSVFGSDAEYINAGDLEFPYWLMKSDELLGLMVDRAESAAPNQIAKFKELLQNAKEIHAENQNLKIPKITIDTPVYFDFKSIIDEFEKLDVQMVTGTSGKPIKGPLNGDFTRLLMRIDSRLNDKRYDLIFKPTTYNTSASMEVLFRKILGEETTPKKIVIIDMSAIPFDVRNSVISLILRCLFDFAYWYKKVNSKAYPISVFCDEAHIYFNDKDQNSEAARLSAERISKEGRKYGISLTVISQRPREVSATILSQCNTFLCLRISNPEDQSYVKSLLPDSIRGIVSMFSNLRRGECILLGDSVIMPTRIKIHKPDPAPSSDDTSFYKEWNLAHEKINFMLVLDAWRKQQVK